jgi:hypothetical protein
MWWIHDEISEEVRKSSNFSLCSVRIFAAMDLTMGIYSFSVVKIPFW